MLRICATIWTRYGPAGALDRQPPRLSPTLARIDAIPAFPFDGVARLAARS